MKRAIQPSTNLALSMRDMGYSFESALADVIDNSLAADASNIEILSPPTFPLALAIVDNGHGMSEGEIIEAFTLSIKSPDEMRSSNDLGRFGLGMKTASWSQCRKVTLASRFEGKLAAAVLDLDNLEEWSIEVLNQTEIMQLRFIDCLKNDGTLLIWENIDRIELSDERRSKDHMRSLLSDAKDHLQLVFHRFLEYEPGFPKVTISINGIVLEPENPFFANLPATQETPIETITIPGKGDVRIQSFTLPHHGKVSPQVWGRIGRKEGHLKNQGFYLYRERRLIVWGTWFRIIRQQELYKLSRVKIDIPNTMDEDWQINIMKSYAVPPRIVYNRLKNILETINTPSKRVYTNRGTALFDGPYPVWQKVKSQGMTSYRVNEEHPIIHDFENKLDEGEKQQLRHVLEVIAASIPVDALYSDLGSEPELIDMAKMSDEDVRYAVMEILPTLLDIYHDKETVLDVLRSQEPYRSNIAVVEAILDEEIDDG